MFDVILVMAGTGARTGLPYNKVLYKIKGKPLFRYSLETFVSIDQCNKVVLVVNPNDYLEIEKETFGFNKVTIVIGGATRQESVAKGLNKSVSDIVLIHDAARPLIKKEKIIEVYKGTIKYNYATLGICPKDTIYDTKESIKVLNRKQLLNIQTPQGVQRIEYKNILEQALKEEIVVTDDIGLLIKKLKIQPMIIEGDVNNIKVTYEQDLYFIEYMIERGYYEL